jgi:hypothetical protein
LPDKGSTGALGSVRIRATAEDDALAIARVQVETWRSAYREIVPRAYLAGLSPEERVGLWRNVLDGPRRRFYERLEGAASAAWSREASGE